MFSFSADGADDFAEREMKEDPAVSGGYTAEIPASATMGGVVDYFIEAMADSETPVAAKGSANKTLKITMLNANGQPLVAGEEEAAEEGRRADESPSFFIGLSFGSGVGYTTGNGEIFGGQGRSAGIVDVPAAAPRARVWLLRHPRVLAVGAASPAADSLGRDGVSRCGTAACPTGSVRRAATRSLASRGATYFFGEGDFRTYVAGTLGLGTIRHVIGFNSQPHCGTNMMSTCVDTVPSGPVFAGLGAGIMYNVSPTSR